MRLMDKVRHRIRSFLRIENQQDNAMILQNLTDFETEANINRVWSWGDKDALEQLYKQLRSTNERLSFWAATPSMGIVKRHTGLPGNIVATLTDVIIADMNDITVSSERKSEWEEIKKVRNMEQLLSGAIRETLIVGDGAFRISLDLGENEYPYIDFISGENIEYTYVKGQIKEIIFKSRITCDHKDYVLEETYGYGYIKNELYYGDSKVKLSSVPALQNVVELVEFDKSFIMAEPLKFFESTKFKGRGKSVYTGKHDSFDSMDETWSQWMDALRKGRSKEYIPKSLLPVDQNTGQYKKPNAFDDAFIAIEDSITEGTTNKIDLIQPNIPHESYLQTYMTALDLCLQGVISPSTLGIDVKKMDNAEAQREKEKATLYTRNKVVSAIQDTVPRLINTYFKVIDTMNKKTLKDIDVEIPFGEYANPSFESQVETVVKGKQGGIMSIEAAVDELYGDSKDEEWKAGEVERLKAEQGVQQMEEPAVNQTVEEMNTNESDIEVNKLNGAQIGSLMNMIAMVKSGQLTRNEAINIISATLGVSRESAETFIEGGM